MSTPRTTPLDAVHRELGATMVDFAGWSMPLRYGSETAEHHAVRRAAGLFDLSHMGEIEVTGPGAAAALDYAVVGDMGGLAAGRAKYTMICSEDGGIQDDLIVYRLEDARYLVVANASNAQVVLDALVARSSGFDAAVVDARDDYALLAVQGPAAVGLLAPLASVDLGSVRYYTGVPATVAGVVVLLARTGYTGEDGFELFCPSPAAPGLWSSLLGAGAGSDPGAGGGLVPCGLACRDTLRLEAGMPLYGHELTAALTPFDAGLGRVVAFKKAADFVGRGALAERSSVVPARKLVGLVAEGRRVPRAGYPVLAGTGSVGEGAPPGAGPVVGEVTSGAPSPTIGKPIAMAYVDVPVADAGGTLAVDIRGSAEPAEVVPLPFYKRPERSAP